MDLIVLRIHIVLIEVLFVIDFKIVRIMWMKLIVNTVSLFLVEFHLIVLFFSNDLIGNHRPPLEAIHKGRSGECKSERPDKFEQLSRILKEK